MGVDKLCGDVATTLVRCMTSYLAMFIWLTM